MKKLLVATILGLVSAPITARADGAIVLYTYSGFGHNQVTYGTPFLPGPQGTGLGSTFHLDLYWAPGVVTVDTLNDPYDWTEPNQLGPFERASASNPNLPKVFDDGYLDAANTGVRLSGWTSGPVTLMLTAYNGSSFQTASIRGHSPTFQITPQPFPGSGPNVGDVMPAWSVYLDPMLPAINYPYTPTFSNGSSNMTVTVGNSVATYAGSRTSTPLYYQWRHNGTNIAGASGVRQPRPPEAYFLAGYTNSIPNASSQDAGTYDLILTNAYRSITSRVATLSVVLPPPTISGVLSNNMFDLSCAGVASQLYVLQYAPNLTPPIVWSPIATNAADSNGLFNFTETISLLEPERYYRLTTP